MNKGKKLIFSMIAATIAGCATAPAQSVGPNIAKVPVRKASNDTQLAFDAADDKLSLAPQPKGKLTLAPSKIPPAVTQNISAPENTDDAYSEVKALKYKLAEFECSDEVKDTMKSSGNIMKAAGIFAKLGGLPDVSKVIGYGQSARTLLPKLTGEREKRVEGCMRAKGLGLGRPLTVSNMKLKRRKTASIQRVELPHSKTPAIIKSQASIGDTRSVLVHTKLGFLGTNPLGFKIKLIIDGEVVDKVRVGRDTILHIPSNASELLVKFRSKSTKPFDLTSVQKGDTIVIYPNTAPFSKHPFKIRLES